MPDTNTYTIRDHTTGSPVDTNRTFEYDAYNDSVNGPATAGLELLGSDVVAGSAQQALEVTGLSIAKDVPFLIHYNLKSAGVGPTMLPLLYFNGNETDANYQSNRLIQSNVTITGDRNNFPYAGVVDNNEAGMGFMFCTLSRDGFIHCTFQGARFMAADQDAFWQTIVDDTNVLGSITSVKIDSAIAAGLAIGSTMQVKKF